MNSENSNLLTQELIQSMQQLSRLRLSHTSQFGRTPGEIELLSILFMHVKVGKQAMTASELSKQLNITPSGITHLINPLEEDGHIERLPDTNDRRIVRIGLTKQGLEQAEMLISMLQEKLSGLIDFLGVADSKLLIRLIKSAIKYISSQPK